MSDPEFEMEVDELCHLDTNREPTEKEMYDIYCWIDHLEFSRSKKNISRDFSDGVLMAELISKYLPRSVELGSYYMALSKKNKVNNWEHLNAKVFNKLGYKVDKQKMNDIMESKAGAIEKVLFELRPLIARKNRSILNYRIGQKPQVPDVILKPPAIPMAMTQAAEIKRRPRSVQVTQNVPKTAHNPKPKIQTVTKPTHVEPQEVSALKQDAKSFNSIEQVLPSDIKLITLEPIPNLATKSCEGDLSRKVGKSPHSRRNSKSPSLSRSDSRKYAKGKRSMEKHEVEHVAEVEFQIEAETFPNEEGPKVPSKSQKDAWSSSPPTTPYGFEVFGEQVVLSGNATSSTEELVKEGERKLEGIPGVHLGFYGLV